ncbi:MBL fold metallo-hydrolase [Carboxydochorda subterranea]|uniref:MBL fold metallo-hydrolase n=1 Tax=Carboxydichorda subterranea TaxID=3109565 RepID=A0ABZ1BWG2_9FIRM|nr:MBL fold metallo-hydrolase [Limnochorda sp. L945t]WRP17141.1 MBL fold metallo-hydrolase [Limnochorda sp. L945t]
MTDPTHGVTSGPPAHGLRVVTLPVGMLEANCYLLIDEASGTVVVIDPGADASRILEAIGSRHVTHLLLTHGHFDHVGALAPLKEATRAPILAHPADRDMLHMAPDAAALFTGEPVPQPPAPDAALEHGQRIAVASVELQVRHTPGHSPGSVVFVMTRPTPAVFSGDTLFAGSVGRTDMPGGDPEALHRSIREQLLSLDDATPVYPGHGPSTTIGRERTTNPFLLRSEPAVACSGGRSDDAHGL